MTATAQPMRVTVYTRPDCALCEEVLRDLLDLQSEAVFEIQVRDILDSASDFARYQYLVPVVDIEGGELLLPPHDWYRLQQALRRVESTPHGTGSG